MKAFNFKSLCLTALMFGSSVVGWAADYDFAVDGIYYKKYNSHYNYTTGKYEYDAYVAPLFSNSDSNAGAYSGEVSVPESVVYDGVTYPVTGVYSYAFYKCNGVTKVTLPSSVKTISNYAFRYCSGLEEIDMPGVTSFGYYGFQGCTSLSSVTIAEGTTSLGYDNIFSGCSNLSSVDLPSTLSQIGYGTFENCTSLTTLTLPDNIQTIGSRAFRECTSLESITLSSSLTAISENAFYNCAKLQSIALPSGIISLGSYAFYGCASLQSINFPEGLTTIGDYALFDCKQITSISLPASLIYIGNSAFRGTAVDAYTIAAGNKKFEVADRVLYSKGLKDMVAFPTGKAGEFTIPSSVTTIAAGTFSGATQMTKVTIPASVTNIGNSAFSSCSALAEVVIEDSEQELSMGTYLFDGDPIEKVYLGRNFRASSTTDTYVQPFSRKSSLKEVSIGCKVTKVPYYTFYSCSDITNVIYQGTLSQWCGISFENYAATPFYNSSNATLTIGGKAISGNIEIPAEVTEIGSYAFAYNKSFTGVKMSAVTKINNNAFNAPLLEKIEISSAAPATLGSDVFNSTALFFVEPTDVNAYKSEWSDLNSRIFPNTSLQTIANTTAVDGMSGLLTAIGGVGHESEIVSLKINGTINGYDIMLLRNKLTNLRYLDLSGATIVPEKDNYQYYTGYSTQENVLGAYSFYEVDNLRSVVLPQNITSIGSYAFARCKNLTEVTGMPETCTTIGSYAFAGGWESVGGYVYPVLSQIEIGNGVTSIGNNAFYYCHSLRQISIPASVKTINSNAFNDCNSLESVSFAEGLESIGSSAFYGCRSLKELRLPTSLQTIYGSAFKNCSSLQEIHVPSMLTAIYDEAFEGCSAAKDVYAYTLSPIRISQKSFVYDGVTLHAPQEPYSVFWDYYSNTQWSQFTNVVPFDAKYSNWYLGENQDIALEDGETIPNEDGEQAEGDLNPGSGLEYKPGSYQWLDKLNLKWKGGKFPSLIDNPNVIIDELTFLLDVEANKWYFFCFPFDIDLKDARQKFNGKFVWRRYDGEERANGQVGWVNVDNQYLKAGEGYIFQTNKPGEIELTITDPIFTGADKDVDIESHPADNPEDASWNFIGNPNLCYFNVGNLASTYNRPITVWNPVTNNYDAISPEDDDYVFHPFEAFFVQKPSDKEAVTFESEYRETSTGAEKTQKARQRARARMDINQKRLIVNLIVGTDAAHSDRTRIVFNDESKQEYDPAVDAVKFESDEAAIQLYTLDNKEVKYAINERPNADRQVKIGFIAAEDGVYYFSAERMDCHMTLKDNVTGTIFDLCEGEYEFRTDAGQYNDRFVLTATRAATGIDEVTSGGFAVQGVEGGIALSGLNGETADIYNVGGTLVASASENGVVDLPAGSYVVKMGEKSRKVIVK